MSDYLSNIVEKSLNLSEVAHPRLTMLFEPQPPSVWLTPELDLNVNPVDGDRQMTEEGKPNAFSNIKPIVDYPTEPKSLVEGKPEVSPIDIERQNNASSLETKTQFVQTTHKEKQNLESKPKTWASKEKKKNKPEHKEELPELTAKKVKQRPVLQERVKPIIVDEIAAAKNQSSTSLIEKPDSALSLETPAPSMLMVQSPISLAPRKAQTSKVPGATPLPTGTVKVTIGRIEVRAIIPTNKPKKQRTTPPVMSLGEYLQKRSNGGK